MALHSQFTPISHHPRDRRIYLPAGSRHVRRRLRIAVLVALAWLAIGSAPLSAQRSEREARGIVSSIAGTIYNLAWPTAEYQDLTLGEVQRIDNGWDVPIVLYGRSAFGGGMLWLELVVELRNGSLHDIRLGRDNHILAPPFATLATTAAIVAAIVEQQQAQGAPGTTQRAVMAPSPAPAAPLSMSPEEHDRRDAAMLVGTWRDENSVFTYYADGRMTCVWNSGRRMYGSWSIHSDTLTWHYADGDDDASVLESLSTYEHRTRNLSDGSVWNARRIRY
ncbi:MAG TPA: hypothetical protein VGO40_19665 [Longimicrobium sp.]|jgi:hypothetical protein|nr:hypothetical protein [Longimicrobium sp.]